MKKLDFTGYLIVLAWLLIILYSLTPAIYTYFESQNH